MKQSECGVIAYGLTQKHLTLNLKKTLPRDYEYIKIGTWINQINKGFYPVRWGKATKNGTKAKFEKLNKNNTFDMEIAKIQEYCKEINKKYGTNFNIKFK